MKGILFSVFFIMFCGGAYLITNRHGSFTRFAKLIEHQLKAKKLVYGTA